MKEGRQGCLHNALTREASQQRGRWDRPLPCLEAPAFPPRSSGEFEQSPLFEAPERRGGREQLSAPAGELAVRGGLDVRARGAPGSLRMVRMRGLAAGPGGAGLAGLGGADVDPPATPTPPSPHPGLAPPPPWEGARTEPIAAGLSWCVSMTTRAAL